jgi:predicted GNAT family N-acyltransferase
MVTLLLAVRNPETRIHFLELLALATPRLTTCSATQPFEIVEINNEYEEIIARLRTHFSAGRAGMLVLISDWLVPCDSDRTLGTLAKACLTEFGNNALGTIAIMRPVRRMTDIDRTIAADCSKHHLENTLGLVIDRLNYLAVPARRSQVDWNMITIRPLRMGNETEFRNYFLLRHRIYTIMGYLVQDVEDSRSRLEINEADVHAMHVGAFYRDGAQERLVGAARVVTNGEADRPLKEMFEVLVDNDPVAKHSLSTPYTLGLPIFHTHRAMNPIMTEVFSRNQSCGELSRVIVDPEFRGSGISRKLIGETLRRSIARGAQRLFLECLQVHERLYEKHGFQRINGVVGPVVDVGRTMIAMEMRIDSIREIQANLSQVA